MSSATIVQGGPLVVAAAIAMAVGIIGFLSPCVLPLVPGYLAYVGGMSGRAGPRRTAAGAALFVCGFSAVVVGQGVAFGALGGTLAAHETTISRLLGAVTVLMGIVFVGGFSALQREARWHRLPHPGLAGAPLLGMAFGLAWTRA